MQVIPMALMAAGPVLAGGGAAAAGGGIGFGTLLSGGSSILGGLSQISEGRQQAEADLARSSALEGQALFADFNATDEINQGRAEAIEELEALNETLAFNTVAGFASGLAGSGSSADASFDAIEDANFRLDLTRSGASSRAGARRADARSFRAEARSARKDASNARRGGFLKAAGTAFNFFDSVTRRG